LCGDLILFQLRVKLFPTQYCLGLLAGTFRESRLC
jgi:hypothetical protein